MPRVGFEPTMPVSERAKIFRSLDRAATVTSIKLHIETKYREVHNYQTLYQCQLDLGIILFTKFNIRIQSVESVSRLHTVIL
jgi:hypothetical protein